MDKTTGSTAQAAGGEPKPEMLEATPAPRKGDSMHPVPLLMGILVLATVMTYFVPSGSFARADGLVIPGSFETLEKSIELAGLFAAEPPPGDAVAPISVVQMFMAIPAGLERGGGLIFMVLIIGGMFGILTEAGAIARGLERLLSVVRGNIYVLTIGLMIILSAGSTFLGLASEYLIIIPLMVSLANRFAMPNIIGLAYVVVSVKIGYIASVTNPLPLTVAQPLLDLPIFSGAALRLAAFLVFLVIGIAFMLVVVHRAKPSLEEASVEAAASRLSHRDVALLVSLAAGMGCLVYGSSRWQWGHEAFSAYCVALSCVLAAMSGLGINKAATAFVAGMKTVLMASFLIGIAMAISIVFEQGKILDTVVFNLTQLVGDNGPVLAAHGMFVSQLLLDFLIPSTSGQAAVAMPILGPSGQITGVDPQITLLAFLFGNGLTNMITPTSGTLLAHLATGRVSWTDWARFIFPLWLIFAVVSLVILAVAVGL